MELSTRQIIESGLIPEGMDAMFVTVCPNAPSPEYAALGGLSCAAWAEQPAYPTLVDRRDDFPSARNVCYRAIATTEHAASSYNQPVVVLIDGTAIGPADRVYRDISYVVEAADLNPLYARLQSAGYPVVSEQI